SGTRGIQEPEESRGPRNPEARGIQRPEESRGPRNPEARGIQRPEESRGPRSSETRGAGERLPEVDLEDLVVTWSRGRPAVGVATREPQVATMDGGRPDSADCADIPGPPPGDPRGVELDPPQALAGDSADECHGLSAHAGDRDAAGSAAVRMPY